MRDYNRPRLLESRRRTTTEGRSLELTGGAGGPRDVETLQGLRVGTGGPGDSRGASVPVTAPRPPSGTRALLESEERR